MSTSKSIDKICAIVMAFSVLLTLLFTQGEALGIQVAAKTMGYEQKLFDTSKVHNIAIVMDDWEGFLETCEDEEYSVCSVVIDGESYKNVALRAKGNTSLSSVKNMDSSRYSFKIEFDHYDKGKTYYGLDKLCLNNIIQDNTMMKDYLSYQWMRGFGVDAALCSFVYITVNGEDWGLYLAVEGVEDSYLQRTKAGEGNLYKPDTTQNGGGRGHGRDFDQDDFMDRMEEYGFDFGRNKSGEESDEESGEKSGEGSDEGSDKKSDEAEKTPSQAVPEMGTETATEMNPETDSKAAAASGEESLPEGEPEAESQSEGTSQTESTSQTPGEVATEDFPLPPGEGTFGEGEGMPTPFDMPEGTQMPGMPEDGGFMSGGGPGGGGPGGGGGFGGMGSDAVKLQYIDDNVESYEDIFSSAKTDYSEADAKALIASLKSITNAANHLLEEASSEASEASSEVSEEETMALEEMAEASEEAGEGTTEEAGSVPEDTQEEGAASEETSEAVDLTDAIPICEAVDEEQVMRYFVVHNFLCNGDSYIGAMIHNYYLYEGKDGQLSMIPWDYNLAFGGFQSTDATSTVNASIDEPLSGTLQDRPMFGWIFSQEEYVDAYHSLFEQFLEEYYESGRLEEMITQTAELIAPYVEKDPTKFCTYEEFNTGVEALKQFCSLRCEAVERQLAGDSTQVDASDLTLSDMGSMNHGGAGGGPGGGEMGGGPGGGFHNGSGMRPGRGEGRGRMEEAMGDSEMPSPEKGQEEQVSSEEGQEEQASPEEAQVSSEEGQEVQAAPEEAQASSEEGQEAQAPPIKESQETATTENEKS